MERTVAETTTWLREFEIFADDQDPLEQAVTALRKRGLAGRARRRGARRVLRLAGDHGPVPPPPGPDRGRHRPRRGRARDQVRRGDPLIRQACRITEAGAIAALDAIRPGVTENAVSSAAYAAMMAEGSDFFAGDPIVTSGWRSGSRTSRSGTGALEPGDTILLELSGCRRRYFGPLMRGAAIGPVRDEVRRMSDVIIEALNAAIAGDPARRDQRRGGRGVPGADRARRLRAELPQAHRATRSASATRPAGARGTS